MKNPKLKKISLLVFFLVLITPLIATAAVIPNPAPSFFISLPSNTFLGIIELVINALLGLVATLCLLFIIIGGFQYITSGVNEKQAETGKKTLANAIIGLVIVILSYAIVVVVINAFP